MKYWGQLDNAVLFNRIFTAPVEIGLVSLHSVVIDNSYHRLTILFDIDELPDRPPEKWVREGFNTCRIGMDCYEVEGVILKNIPCTEKLHVRISQAEEEGFFISLVSTSSVIEFCARVLSLCGPSVYINGGLTKENL